MLKKLEVDVKPTYDMKKLILLLFIPLVFTCDLNNKVISKVYKNSEHNLSFRYNSNWTEQEPQLESTLCLFYEKKLNASCNISSIRADRSEVEKYDKKYHTSLTNGVYNDVKNLNVKFEKIGPSKFSVCDFDFTYPNTNSNKVYGRAIIYTTIKNGNRYMMIFTVKKENYFLLENDIFSMSSTLFIL